MNSLDLLSVQPGVLAPQVNQPDIKSAFNDPEAVQVAKDFEAMMIEQVLKSMRSASDVLAKDGLPNSREQKFWQDWQDSQLGLKWPVAVALGWRIMSLSR